MLQALQKLQLADGVQGKTSRLLVKQKSGEMVDDNKKGKMAQLSKGNARTSLEPLFRCSFDPLLCIHNHTFLLRLGPNQCNWQDSRPQNMVEVWRKTFQSKMQSLFDRFCSRWLDPCLESDFKMSDCFTYFAVSHIKDIPKRQFQDSLC